MRVSITKEIGFDAGHRIPAHHSKCKNLHGHRYRVIACIEGPVKEIRGLSDDGMVADFGDLKELLTRVIHDPHDHAFIVYVGDAETREALSIFGPAHRTVVVPFIPTAENLAQYFFDLLRAEIAEKFKTSGFTLVYLDLYETPTSMARVSN